MTRKALTAAFFVLAATTTDVCAESQKDYGIVALFKFLQKTDTKIFPDSGIDWVWSVQYLLKGNKTANGGCHFEESGSTVGNPGKKPVITIEAAVNRESCESLIIKGQPTPSSWEILRRVITSAKKSPGLNFVSPVPAAATPAYSADYPPNAQNTFQYTLTYTDGNNPIIKGLGGLFSFNAAQIAAKVSYSYNNDVPSPSSSPTCNVHASQTAIVAGGGNPGFAGWSEKSGASCFTEVELASNSYFYTSLAWDANGNAIPADPSFCNIPISQSPMCEPDYNQQYLDQGVLVPRPVSLALQGLRSSTTPMLRPSLIANLLAA